MNRHPCRVLVLANVPVISGCRNILVWSSCCLSYEVCNILCILFERIAAPYLSCCADILLHTLCYVRPCPVLLDHGNVSSVSQSSLPEQLHPMLLLSSGVYVIHTRHRHMYRALDHGVPIQHPCPPGAMSGLSALSFFCVYYSQPPTHFVCGVAHKP